MTVAEDMDACAELVLRVRRDAVAYEEVAPECITVREISTISYLHVRL